MLISKAERDRDAPPAARSETGEVAVRSLELHWPATRMAGASYLGHPPVFQERHQGAGLDAELPGVNWHSRQEASVAACATILASAVLIPLCMTFWKHHCIYLGKFLKVTQKTNNKNYWEVISWANFH